MATKVLKPFHNGRSTNFNFKVEPFLLDSLFLSQGQALPISYRILLGGNEYVTPSVFINLLLTLKTEKRFQDVRFATSTLKPGFNFYLFLYVFSSVDTLCTILKIYCTVQIDTNLIRM